MTNYGDNQPIQQDGAADTSTGLNAGGDDISLIDYIALLLRHKKMISAVTGAAFILSVLVSLLLPVRYTGTVHILPPQDNGGFPGDLLNQADNLFGNLLAGLKKGKVSAELYAGILQSRTVADALVAKFNLKKLYDFDYIEDVYKKLDERTTIQIDNKSRIISISVEDHDRLRAADMANAYAEALDSINRSISATEGQKKRQFLESRLTAVKKDLEHAENALKAFQEEHHLIEPKDQAAASIEMAAKIKGEIIAAQTELKILRQFGTEKQNEAVMLKAQIAGLEQQLSIIEAGSSAEKNKAQSQTGDTHELFIPIGDMPQLGLQLSRLSREAKVQEKVFELVTTQFEIAKMEEARDMPVVQVLDRALPPEKKSYPRRMSMVLLNTFTFFIIAVVLALAVDFAQRFRQARPDQYSALKAHFHYKTPESILLCIRYLVQILNRVKTQLLQKINKKK